MYKLTYFLFLFLCLPQNLWAWGKVGHQSTALIAEKHLNQKAIKEIKSLIGTTDLRESSLWPDKIKANASWHHSKPFHFTSVDDGQDYYSSLKNLTASEIEEGDAVRALVKSEDILRSPKSSKNEKAIALKFLVHILSDIHQPLHTGRPADHGGNFVKLDWFGKATNLHSIWDFGILEALLSSLKAPQLSNDTDTYVSIINIPSTKKQSTPVSSGNYLEWHNESQRIRQQAYDLVNMDNAVAAEKFRKVVDERIYLSGIRLAQLLNDIFSNVAINKEGLILRAQLNKILGASHLNQILLSPASDKNQKSRSFLFQTDYNQKYDCPHEH